MLSSRVSHFSAAILHRKALRYVLRLRKHSLSSTAAEKAPSALSLTAVGLLAGGVGSLVGLGGSFVALPLMMGPLGMTAHIASGSSMAVVLATASSGAAAYLLRDTHALEKIRAATWDRFPASIGGVHVLTACSLALTSSLTAVAGAKLSKVLTQRQLKTLLGVFMLLTVPSVPLREYVKTLTRIDTNTATATVGGRETEKESLMERAARPLTIGAFSGLTAGLLGIGGGMITVPALCVFTDLDYQVALGTSLAAMIPAAITGSLTHLQQGSMLPRVALPLAIGSAAGAFLGGKFGKDLHEDGLKWGFAGMMAMLGTRTLRQALRMAK